MQIAIRKSSRGYQSITTEALSGELLNRDDAKDLAEQLVDAAYDILMNCGLDVLSEQAAILANEIGGTGFVK